MAEQNNTPGEPPDEAENILARLMRLDELHLRVGTDQALGAVTIVDRPGRIVAYVDGCDIAALGRGVVVTAPPEIKLRTALEIRHRTGNPLALVGDGKLIGVIGDDEIYGGILRQTAIAG
jgi:glycine betaine/proline transport system ATP-binding protein